MLKRLVAVLLLFWLLERQVLSSGTAFRASNPLDVRTAGVTEGFARVDARPGTGPEASPATSVPFAVTVRGGLLRLDFASPVRVKTIRIFDRRGLPVFTYRPGKSFATLGWVWDGRDARGRLLPRGRYSVRVQTDTAAMSCAVDWNPAS